MIPSVTAKLYSRCCENESFIRFAKAPRKDGKRDKAKIEPLIIFRGHKSRNTAVFFFFFVLQL
jgi:hypothetical protein